MKIAGIFAGLWCLAAQWETCVAGGKKKKPKIDVPVAQTFGDGTPVFDMSVANDMLAVTYFEGDRIYIYEKDVFDWEITAEITYSSLGTDTSDGVHVALDGVDSMIIADLLGNLWIYKKNGNSWSEVQSFVIGTEDDQVGSELAMIPGIAVAGCYTCEQVSVFDLDGSTWNVQTIEAPGVGEDFGWAVDIEQSLSANKDVLAIAADEADNNMGAVYLYSRTLGSQGSFQMEERLTSKQGEEGDFFGDEVALGGDGTKLVVGATYSKDNKGSAHIFERQQKNGQWRLLQSFNSPLRKSGAAFGFGADINHDGTRMAISATFYDPNLDQNLGQGRVYYYTSTGGKFRLAATLTAEDEEDDGFGEFVRLDQNALFVASYPLVLPGVSVPSFHIYDFDPPLNSFDACQTIEGASTPTSDGLLVLVDVPDHKQPDAEVQIQEEVLDSLVNNQLSNTGSCLNVARQGGVVDTVDGLFGAPLEMYNTILFISSQSFTGKERKEACKMRRKLKKENPDLNFICFNPSNRQNSAWDFNKCFCDALWLTLDFRNDDDNAQDFAEQMALWVTNPPGDDGDGGDGGVAPPGGVTPLPKPADPCPGIKTLEACRAVERDINGETVLKSRNQCYFSKGKCRLLTKFYPIYDVSL